LYGCIHPCSSVWIEEYTGMPDISAESGAEDSADLFIESEEEEYE